MAHAGRLGGAGAGAGDWVDGLDGGQADTAPPRQQTQTRVTARNWRIAGILFLIAAEAVLYGYSYPFFSLALEKHGLQTWLIGLNASLAGAGILIVGPMLPRLIRVLGLRRLVAGLFLISLLSFAVLLFTHAIAVWFLSRFIMGACFAALWSTTEIWLNGVVDDKHRGRIIGASATLYAGAQFIGPLTLSMVGVTGALPLITAMVPLAAGVIVALSIRSEHGEPEKAAPERAETLWLAFTLATPLIIAAFLAGVTETALQSLLPLYALAHHMTDSQAAQLVALFSFGEAILVAALGWGADRFGRRRALRFCAFLAVTVMILLPASIYQFALLGPSLFLAGGVISGIYTLGVIEIGQVHRGQRLAIVSTGFAMAYAAGSVVGSPPIGFAIDVFGPSALPILITVCFLAMTLTIVLRRDAKPVMTTRQVQTAAVAAAAQEIAAPVRERPRLAVVQRAPAPQVDDARVTAEPAMDPALAPEAFPMLAALASVTLTPEAIAALSFSERQAYELAASFRDRAADIALRAAERERRRTRAYQGLERRAPVTRRPAQATAKPRGALA